MRGAHLTECRALFVSATPVPVVKETFSNREIPQKAFFPAESKASKSVFSG